MSGSVVTLFVGSLAYLISTFLGGYCWHLVVFNDAYASLKAWTKFDDPVIPLGFAACALQGLLISHMLPLYQKATGSHGVVRGVIFGIWVAVFMFSVAVIAHSAKTEMPCVIGFVALEGCYCLLQFPISCAAVVFAQKRSSRRLVPPRAAAPMTAA